MRIGIDGSRLMDPTPTGVGRYAISLLHEMVAIDAAYGFGDEYQLGYFSRPSVDPAILERFEGLSLHPVRALPRRAYDALDRYLKAPTFDRLARMTPDVFLFPAFTSWRLSRCRISFTIIYDLAFLDRPETVPARFRNHLVKAVPRAIARSVRGGIITISEFSKRRIVSEYGLPPELVTVAPPGVDVMTFYPRTAAEVSRVRNRYAIPPVYALVVGTLEPRKNLSALLIAFASLPDRVKRDMPLVVAGKVGWLDEELRRDMDRARKAGVKIIEPGYVPDEDVPALMTGARVFIYPSLYEGFGMPVAEALACGATVVSSSTSSMREAGGNAAIYVDPSSVELIAMGVELAYGLSDGERMALRERGFAWARSLSWRDSALRVRDALTDAYAEWRRPANEPERAPAAKATL